MAKITRKSANWETMDSKPISRREFDDDGDDMAATDGPSLSVKSKTTFAPRDPGLSERSQRPMTDLRDRDD